MADNLSYHIIPQNFIDPRTGQPTAAAQRFLLGLFNRVGGSTAPADSLASEVQQNQIVSVFNQTRVQNISDAGDFIGSLSTGLFLSYTANKTFELTAVPETSAAGSTGSLQYNDNGAFAGASVHISGNNLSFTSTAGTNIGISTTQKLAFYGGAPITRAAAITQTYNTASRTAANLTSSTISGTATNVVPWGLGSSTEVVNLIGAVNALRVDLINVKQVLNAVIDDLQAYNLEG